MRELVPDAVTHSVVDRLRREAPSVKALARAIAILGDDVELRHAAQLADIAPAEAVACADRLVDLALLRPGAPLTFLHPLLRSTVLADLRNAGRVALHARAAAVLEADGAPIAAVAAHMIELEPAGDRAVVTVLREAARQALAGGAADIAARQLHRARREPPRLPDRGAVLAELGYAASVAGDAATASEALEASVLLATNPVNAWSAACAPSARTSSSTAVWTRRRSSPSSPTSTPWGRSPERPRRPWWAMWSRREPTSRRCSLSSACDSNASRPRPATP